MEGRDLGLVQDRNPAGWQSFELCRKGVWDEQQCTRMPTLCRLLKDDLAVSGLIPARKVAAINDKGGWLPDPSVWIEPSMHGQRVLLDAQTFNNNGGYIPDQVVAVLRLACSELKHHCSRTLVGRSISVLSISVLAALPACCHLYMLTRAVLMPLLLERPQALT